MKVINKQGLLFGKVSIIDLFIVIFIVAVLAFGFMKLTEEKGSAFVSSTHDYEIDVLFKALYDGFPEEMAVGDEVYDDRTGSSLGTITAIETTPAVDEVEAADGSIVKSEIPDRYDVIISLEGQGTYNPRSGLVAAGDARYIGTALKVRTHKFLVEGVILDVEVDVEGE